MVRVTFRIGAHFKPAATSRPRVACFHHAAASFCPRHFGAPHCSDIADSEKQQQKKKAGLEEPGLRYWPREADTITFQEG
jgi:hypothetical protein